MRHLFIALMLGGCATAPTTAYDTETTNPVSIVWHKTTMAYAAYVKEHGGKIDPATNGFYVVRDGVCHIYAPDDPTFHTLGHEVKHCFDGKFHN